MKKGNDDDFIELPRVAFRYWEVQPAVGYDTLIAYADKDRRPALLDARRGRSRLRWATS